MQKTQHLNKHICVIQSESLKNIVDQGPLLLFDNLTVLNGSICCYLFQMLRGDERGVGGGRGLIFSKYNLFFQIIIREHFYLSWRRNKEGEAEINQDTGRKILEFVSIERKDGGGWAIPGSDKSLY